MLDAAERLREKNVVFLLAGTGEDAYVNFLRAQIRVRRLPVFLLGFLDNPHAFAAQMDVGVLPSLVREAFPLAALDFMSAGVPVIASNNGGQVESVENEKTGLLVAPAVDAVAAALTRLLADENLRRTLGENARQAFAQQFAYPIFYDKIMAIYGV
ncbi:hypothetical protein FACS1894139_10720 [Planctomycetales bacterium]|nr:hypothetical protein FACS1894139_10720 [Planctomycetales bacterium]